MEDKNNASPAENQDALEQVNKTWPEQQEKIEEEQKAKPQPKPRKRRVSASISPENEKRMKLLMTELGFDDSGMSASERTSAFFELALLVLEAEMEMARVSTNQRFIDEQTLKDYITRKYEENVTNVRPAPLFE